MKMKALVEEALVHWHMVHDEPVGVDEDGKKLYHVFVQEYWWGSDDPEEDQMDDQYIIDEDDLAELERLTRLH